MSDLKPIKDLLSEKDYEKFISELDKLAKNDQFREIMTAGLFDGSIFDETFSVEMRDIPVKDLIPTQYEIDMDKSLLNILKVKFKSSFEDMLIGNGVVLRSAVIVLNNKYILDGHHRWSQVYCANDKATMKCLSLNGNIKPIDMLKVLQIAIATDIKEVPRALVEGTNLLTAKLDTIRKYIMENITPECIAILNKYRFGGWKKNTASEYFIENIQSMRKTSQPIKNAPSRKDMPQTDRSEKAIENVVEGNINFKEPLLKFRTGGKMESKSAPAIYVADLKAYNMGDLNGKWLDLSQYESGAEVMSAISDLLKSWSEKYGDLREEYAIHDYENFPSALYSEYMGEKEFDTIVQITNLAEEHDLPNDIVEYWIGQAVEYDEPIRSYLIENIDEFLYGVYEHKEEYVDNMGGFENLDEKTKEMYFDYDDYFRDLELNDELDFVRDNEFGLYYAFAGKLPISQLKFKSGGKIKNMNRLVRVHFADGDIITTGFNGSDEEIRKYYQIGKYFNLGSVEDNMQPVTKVEILHKYGGRAGEKPKKQYGMENNTKCESCGTEQPQGLCSVYGAEKCIDCCDCASCRERWRKANIDDEKYRQGGEVTDDQYADYLNELITPDWDSEEWIIGGENRADEYYGRYGDALRDHDSIAFEVGRQEYERENTYAGGGEIKLVVFQVKKPNGKWEDRKEWQSNYPYEEELSKLQREFKQDLPSYKTRVIDRVSKSGTTFAKGGRLTIYDIKRRTAETSPYFFTRDTMKFFGHTMKDWKVKALEDGTYLMSAPTRRRDFSGNLVTDQVQYIFTPDNNEITHVPKKYFMTGGNIEPNESPINDLSFRSGGRASSNVVATRNMIKEMESLGILALGVVRERLLSWAEFDLKQMEKTPEDYQNFVVSLSQVRDYNERVIKYLNFDQDVTNDKAVKNLIKDLKSTPMEIGLVLFREFSVQHAEADLVHIKRNPKNWENPVISVNAYKVVLQTMIKTLSFDSYKTGGKVKTKLGWKRDRLFTSSQPHEQAYKKIRKSEIVHGSTSRDKKFKSKEEHEQNYNNKKPQKSYKRMGGEVNTLSALYRQGGEVNTPDALQMKNGGRTYGGIYPQSHMHPMTQFSFDAIMVETYGYNPFYIVEKNVIYTDNAGTDHVIYKIKQNDSAQSIADGVINAVDRKAKAKRKGGEVNALETLQMERGGEINTPDVLEYAKGGKIKEVLTLDNIRKNIMGTISFDMKLQGMRKPQSFSVYPITDDTEVINAQSNKRWAIISTKDGKGIISRSGNTSWHLKADMSTDNALAFKLSESQMNRLFDAIRSTSGKLVGTSIKSENWGADKI